MSQSTYIEVFGAREHNLKNVDVRIPHRSLTVVTGLSGSGKSTLAFDTIYAEGQRRYIDTFSAYARNFLGNIERPDVDEIIGLSPVIAIEQKTTSGNPRSTVGTTTEIYDFLRLLFARAGEAYSYVTGEKMVKYTEDQILERILTDYDGRRILLLAPLVRSRKGHYRELFENLRRRGYLTVRVDGQLQEMVRDMHLDRYKNHDIEVVIDKLEVRESSMTRLKASLRTALEQGDGLTAVCVHGESQLRYFSRKLMCPTSGIAYSDPAPHDFSFNSPKGCCPHCRGTGVVTEVAREKIIPNPALSIYEGGIAPLGKYHANLIFDQIEALCESVGATLKTPLSELPDEVVDKILYDTDKVVRPIFGHII